MHDTIVDYIRSVKTGVSSKILSEKFLKFKNPPDNIAHTAISGLLSGDKRLFRNESGLWFFDESEVLSDGRPINKLALSAVYILTDDSRNTEEICYLALWDIYPQVDYKHGFWLKPPEEILKNMPQLTVNGPHAAFNSDRCTELIKELSTRLQNRVVVLMDFKEHELLLKLLSNYGIAMHEDVLYAMDIACAALPDLHEQVTVQSMCKLILGGRTVPLNAFKLGECFAQCIYESVNVAGSRGICSREEVDEHVKLNRSEALKEKAFSIADIDGLPEKMGVYGLRDNNGEFIYISRCNDLRKNVSCFFDRRFLHTEIEKQICADTISFEAYECGSELESILFKYRLIKKYHPRYNDSDLIAIHEKDRKSQIGDCILFFAHKENNKVMTFWVKQGKKIIMKSLDIKQLGDDLLKRNLQEYFCTDTDKSQDRDSTEEYLVYTWINRNCNNIRIVYVPENVTTDKLVFSFKTNSEIIIKSKQK